MTYELILMPEAAKHLVEWRKSGQKKTLKKTSIYLRNFGNIPAPAPAPDTLNNSKEITPATGVEKSIRATE